MNVVKKNFLRLRLFEPKKETLEKIDIKNLFWPPGPEAIIINFIHPFYTKFWSLQHQQSCQLLKI